MLAVAAAAFGANAPFARLAAQAGVPGDELVALRVAVLLVFLLVLAAVSGVSLRVARTERAALVGLGLATAVVGIGYLSSVAYIPVGIAVLVYYTYPLLILVASRFVDGGRLSGGRLVAFALAFLGIGLAIGPAAQDLDWRGLALAATASIGAATQFFVAARGPGGGGFATIFWIHVVILPAAIAASLACGGPAGASPSMAAAVPVVVSSAGFALRIGGNRRTSAAAAGLIFCLEPIVATVTAARLLDERLSYAQYGGAALVLLGIAASLVPERARRLDAAAGSGLAGP